MESLKNLFNSRDSRDSKENRFLKNITYKDVEFFSFEGYKTWAKCVKIYDGDTGTFVFYYHHIPYKFKMRLMGIDTPEIRSKNEKEVELAIKAKNRLIELIDDKLVYLECLNYDKYGRILTYIYADKKMQKSFNQILVDEGLAYVYDGGKKQDFDELFSDK